MDNQNVIVINSGSSSIKFAIYTMNAHLNKIGYGLVENININPILRIYDKNNSLIEQNSYKKDCNYEYFFELICSNIVKTNQFKCDIAAAGHRVVHGGQDFYSPVLISKEIIQVLKKFIPFAPLHQPYNLEAIETMARLYPHLKQVACFDTAFHRTHPQVADHFAIPRELTEEGIKRYGFHGLSYEFIIRQLNRMNAPKCNGRIIIAHLGNGASMCAVKEGKSQDCTMGFTAVDGLMMGTRCGTLDVGVLLYLLQEKQMSHQAIENLIYKKSGLLGVSGISSDMHVLLQDKTQNAKEAIDLFVYRIRQVLGAYTATLGGLDILVFTGGIGEHSWQIREAVCQNNEWLGIQLNSSFNKSNQLVISDKNSKVMVYAMPTDEEWIIANHCYQLIHKDI